MTFAIRKIGVEFACTTLVVAIGLLCFTRGIRAGQAGHSGDKKEAHPDLSGVWVAPAAVVIPANWRDADGKPLANFPFTPEGQEKFKKNRALHGTEQVASTTSTDPIAKCLPPGVPGIYQFVFPWEVIQTPGRVLLFFEYGNYVRQVFTDGRKHQELTPTWMGDSIGKWDGDTLVIDTDGFNDKTWIDNEGHPHSEELHVVERLRRPDHDHLVVDVTVEDPKTYTKPLTAHRQFELKSDWNIAEFVCEDSGAFSDYQKKVGTEK